MKCELRAMLYIRRAPQRHSPRDGHHRASEEVVRPEQFAVSGGLPTRTLRVASCAGATFWRSGALHHKANKTVEGASARPAGVCCKIPGPQRSTSVSHLRVNGFRRRHEERLP